MMDVPTVPSIITSSTDATSVIASATGGPRRAAKSRLEKTHKVRNLAATPVPFKGSFIGSSVDMLKHVEDGTLLARFKACMENRDVEGFTHLLEEHGEMAASQHGEDLHYFLHEAVLSKCVEIVDALLKVPTVDVRKRDSGGASCLHWLCWFGDDTKSAASLDVMMRLLREPLIEVDARDSRGFTPLMFAVDTCNESFVEALLANGAEVNARSATQTSPILIAVFHGSFSICEMLLQRGAELDVAGSDGLSPLMLAAQMDNLDLVVFLVKSGATVDYSTPTHGNAKSLARSAVVAQFLMDSAFYQTHHDKKKKAKYEKIIEETRKGPLKDLRDSKQDEQQQQGGAVAPSTPDTPPSTRPPRQAPLRLTGQGTSHSSSSLRVSTVPSPSSPGPTRVYTSENYPLDLDYFEHPLLGQAQIGMCMCPGRNKPKKGYAWRRDLASDLQVIKESGADVVVTLVRNVELLSMGIMELFVRVKQLGMESLHFPVVDKWIPKEMNGVVELITKLLEYVNRGKRLVIHCNGGKGRTGLVACAILVAKGLSVEKAIEAIRVRRKGMIRNPAQIVYLRLFETRWRNDHDLGASSSSSDDEKSGTGESSGHSENDRDFAEKLAKKTYHKLHKRDIDSGIIVLSILEAKDLDRAHDCFVQVVSSSGPQGFQRQSGVVKSSSSPTFNFSTHVVVSSLNRWYITVALFDHGDFIAMATVTATSLTPANTPRWWPLIKEDGTPAGSVRTSFTIEK